MLTSYQGALEKQAFWPFSLFDLFHLQNLYFKQRSSIRPFTLESPWFHYLFPMVCTAVKTEAEIIVVKQMLPEERLASGLFYFPAVFLFSVFSFWTFFTFLFSGNHWKRCFQYIIKGFKLFLFFRVRGVIVTGIESLFWSLWERHSLTQCLRNHSDTLWEGEGKTLVGWLIFLKINSAVLEIFI